MNKYALFGGVCALLIANACRENSMGKKTDSRSQSLVSAGTMVYSNHQQLSADFPINSPQPWHVELWSRVIAPGQNSSCPAGRVFIGHGGNDSPTTAFTRVDWPCLNNSSGCFSSTPGNPAIVKEIPAPPNDVVGIQVLGSGPNATCISTTTAPKWLGSSTDMSMVLVGDKIYQLWKLIKYSTSPPLCDPKPTGTARMGLRWSSNCGNSWTVSAIDCPNIDPVPPGSTTPVQGCGDMDRLYYDTLNGNRLYLLGSPSVSSATTTHTRLMVSTSNPPGTSWQHVSYLRTDAVSNQYVGTLINNTQSITSNTGILAIFGCQPNTSTPLFLWSRDNGVTFRSYDVSPRVGTTGPASYPCGSIPGSSTYGQQTGAGGGGFVTHSISRATKNVGPGYKMFRIVYPITEPTRNGTRQSLRYVWVGIDDNNVATTIGPSTEKIFRASDPEGSILQARMIEPTPRGVPGEFVFPNPPLGDLTMLYWVEANPGGAVGNFSLGIHRAYYRLVEGENDWSTGVEMANWQPNLPGTLILDWLHAGWWASGTPAAPVYHFLPVWPENHPGINAINYFLHFNEVRYP